MGVEVRICNQCGLIARTMMTVISRQQPRRITDIYVISSLFFDKTVSNLDGNRASFRSGDEGRRHVSEGDLEQEEGRRIIYDAEHNEKPCV
mmetsp:Transcript_30669/g.44597  ORF Transcript_30669/g.44597 Transcript_30669/m.44597 type:complete len:91 (+) Transcript_30669:388-660(+)